MEKNENYIEEWHSQECKLTPILIFDLLTSNTNPNPDIERIATEIYSIDPWVTPHIPKHFVEIRS